MTNLRSIRIEWSTCNVCPNIKPACRHVFYRGVSDCDILFIGEAPGHDEDMCGLPFVGRSGQLLDKMIERLEYDNRPLEFGITNILACLPTDEKDRIRPPTQKEANACRQRFRDTVEWSRTKSFCLLGKTAKKFVRLSKAQRELPLLELYHPAYILRKGGVSSFQFTQSMLYLEDFLEEVKEYHANKEAKN